MTPATLTDAELIAVTGGKRRAAAQAAALAKLGVPFRFLGRTVEVARTVAQAHALLPDSRPAGIDFSRVR
jgi:hypothetical protein